MDTPDPDPGEEHPHANTQLYGTVSPETNRFSSVRDMMPPYNAPSDPGQEPTMQGFITDYINAFKTEMGELPKYDDYAQIMAYYIPSQLPVVTTLARGFACFDHWFCEVPSQTYCNRSFIHAASSSGFVNNHPVGKFESENDAPTIFERLEDAGKTWKVYVDPEQLVPATALIHARRLMPRFADRFRTILDFYSDAKEGELPNYSFIEPNMLHPHTDMHPPGSCRLRHELHIKPSNAMLGGELLLARVYEAVRDGVNLQDGKSNWTNTLLPSHLRRAWGNLRSRSSTQSLTARNTHRQRGRRIPIRQIRCEGSCHRHIGVGRRGNCSQRGVSSHVRHPDIA